MKTFQYVLFILITCFMGTEFNAMDPHNNDGQGGTYYGPHTPKQKHMKKKKPKKTKSRSYKSIEQESSSEDDLPPEDVFDEDEIETISKRRGIRQPHFED